LPLFVVLAVSAPVVRFVLCGFALLGFLLGLFFKLAGAGAHVHWGWMVGVSIGMGILAFMYEAVCWLVAPRAQR